MFADLIQGFIKDKIKDQITKSIGIDSGKADGAITDVVDSLLWGLAKNTKTTEGATWLLAALDKDHDGSGLDDVMTILWSDNKGAAIVKHILGNKTDMLSKLIGAKNGMDSDSTMKLITTLAPLVMWFLGKEKKSKGFDVDGIASFLWGEKEKIVKNEKEAPLMKFIDMDGDGDVDMDDMMAIMKKFA